MYSLIVSVPSVLTEEEKAMYISVSSLTTYEIIRSGVTPLSVDSIYTVRGVGFCIVVSFEEDDEGIAPYLSIVEGEDSVLSWNKNSLVLETVDNDYILTREVIL